MRVTTGAKSLQQDPRCTPSSGEIDGCTTGQNSTVVPAPPSTPNTPPRGW
ncbi:hypothetical protein WME99_33225 [Sorangium sp. So ce136]